MLIIYSYLDGIKFIIWQMLCLSLPYQLLNNPLPLIQRWLVFESLNLQDLALHELLGSCAGVTGKFFSRLRKGYVDQLEFADHRLPAVEAKKFRA
jgi:hypothetical protein